ncbi:MAG: hypothetical protein HY043_12105 [Verrucomicrobia bacterium]|nr:hypothetical protein [Verrucomicrobiota bacterium]
MTVLHFFAELLTTAIVSLLWWLVLFPVVWLLAVPFISIAARFQKEPYRVGVSEMLLSVHDWWKEWGMTVIP